MATFVIVHGAWGGGWEWRMVAEGLLARGHRVVTPTLTGLSERAHLLSPEIGLATHSQDVVNAVRSAETSDVLLTAHSYGGMPATVAASLVPEHLRGLIYVDAFVPENGQSETDLIDPEWVQAKLVEPARELGDGWLVPFPFPEDLEGYPPQVADRYRASWHPLATFTDHASVKGHVRSLASAYVHCTAKEPGADAFDGAANSAQAHGWLVSEIESGHDVQIEQPENIASKLHDLATQL